MTARSELYEAIGAQGKDWCACQKCHAKRTRLLDAYREEVLAERALAVSWSEYDETVPPRDRITNDMQELTAIADPEHRARRGARTSLNLDAYRDQVLAEAAMQGPQSAAGEG